MMPECQDVPSPIDFTDITQAREWVAHTVARRPWRPKFFAAFATALNEHFDKPIRVAELGSGPGHLANIVLRSCSVETYTALDFSPAMHQLATEHLGDQSERVRFIIADFREPGWTQILGKIDALITMQAAHEVRHKRRLPELLARVWTVIRPGGLLLFCDHYAENAELFLTRDGQRNALAEAGFDPIGLLRDEGGMALYAAGRH